MYQGRLTGALVDSSEVSFVPGQFKQVDFVSDTGTAGSAQHSCIGRALTDSLQVDYTVDANLDALLNLFFEPHDRQIHVRSLK
jgi:hypothetical protein